MYERSAQLTVQGSFRRLYPLDQDRICPTRVVGAGHDDGSNRLDWCQLHPTHLASVIRPHKSPLPSLCSRLDLPRPHASLLAHPCQAPSLPYTHLPRAQTLSFTRPVSPCEATGPRAEGMSIPASSTSSVVVRLPFLYCRRMRCAIGVLEATMAEAVNHIGQAGRARAP